MKSVSPETKVGLFAIIVVILLAYMTLKVGGVFFSWDKGYRLYATFDDISGLDEKTRVKIAGVDAGVIEKIRLREGKAELTLLMEPDVPVYTDATASLRMSGLLGERHLSVTAGTPGLPQLHDGDTISRIIPASDIDALTNQLTAAAAYIGDLAGVLRDIIGDAERKSVAETIHNLKIATEEIREMVKEDREPLHNILVSLESFSEKLNEKGPGLIDDLSRLAHMLGDKGPLLIDDLGSAARDMREVIDENRVALKEGIERIRSASATTDNIVQKIGRGEGTLGKLLEDEKLYQSLAKVAEGAGNTLDVVERLRTFMDFRTEYNATDEEWKGRFDLTLKPDHDKYYILGVVKDLKGSVEKIEKTVDGVRTVEERVDSEIEFTAQFGKRFQDLLLRIGVMESTFGFGADYFILDDSGKIVLDVWDFNAEEVDADNPHVKFGADYSFFRYLFVGAGIDNLLNEKRRGVYVGGGLKFEDKDIKYLIGKTPNISFQ